MSFHFVFFSFSGAHYCHPILFRDPACVGHEVGAEQDDKILMYRERFEAIIKTDGEDSRGGTGNSQRYLSTPYPPFAQPPLSHPPHVLVTSAPGVVDEKQQMWRNEKAVSGMV